MKARALLSVALASAALGAGPAGAAVQVQGVEWELGALVGKGVRTHTAFSKVLSLKVGPGKKLPGRVRAVVVLDNSGGPALEGVVIRYAVRAKLAPADGNGEARWVVPYRVEERRDPALKAGAPQRIPIDTARLAEYLSSLRSSGYWPKALKIEVMLEPKPGVTLDHTMAEAELALDW